MRYRWLGWFLPLLLAACGGSTTTPGDDGGGGTDDGVQTASAQLSINWPARTGSRFVPTLAESIQLEVTDSASPGRATYTRVVARPAGGGTTVETFAGLTPGAVTAVATAYPQAGAQGVAQATAQVQGQAVAGQVYRATLSLATTVTQWVVSPPSGPVLQGQTATLNVTGTNANGDTVLLPPATWQAVNGANLVQLTQAGDQSVTVTGLLSGQASIVATCEQQAGAADSRLTSAPVIVTVVALPTVTATATPTQPGLAETVTFSAAATVDPSLGQIVSWDWDLDGDGSFEQAGLASPQVTTSYDTDGPRTATVRVTDNFGSTATAQVTVDVQSAEIEIVVQ